MAEKKGGATEISGNSLVVLLVILLVLLILTNLGSYYIYSSNTPSSLPKTETATVSEIINGESFRLQDNRVVGLIGIQSPSQGSNFYQESIDFLRFAILNKEVTLEKDSQDKDSSGRLLRYVYVDYNGRNLFVNLESARLGYSVPFSQEPNTKYKSDIASARQECVSNQLNLCGS